MVCVGRQTRRGNPLFHGQQGQKYQNQSYGTLSRMSATANESAKTSAVAGELERQLNLMGFADVTAPKVATPTSFSSRENLFQAMDRGDQSRGGRCHRKAQIQTRFPLIEELGRSVNHEWWTDFKAPCEFVTY